MTKRTTTLIFQGSLLFAIVLHNGCGRGGKEPDALRPGEGLVSTLVGFDEVLAMHAANLDEQFRIQCTPALHAVLMGPSSARPDTDLLGEIYSLNGAFSRTIAWDGDTLEFQAISYYAGWRILNAVRKGQEHQLTAQERDTLSAAKALVASVAGSQMERERRIHDALCDQVEYYTDNGVQGDKDCTIGALLNGKADCDGYADAMVLCCGLAGIPCAATCTATPGKLEKRRIRAFQRKRATCGIW